MTNTTGYVAKSVDYDGGVGVEHEPCGETLTEGAPMQVTEAVDAIHAHSLTCKKHGGA